MIKNNLDRKLTEVEERKIYVIQSVAESLFNIKLEVVVNPSRKNPLEIYGFSFGRKA